MAGFLYVEETLACPRGKFIFRLRMCVFRLRMCILRLRICIFSLKIKKSPVQPGFSMRAVGCFCADARAFPRSFLGKFAVHAGGKNGKFAYLCGS